MYALALLPLALFFPSKLVVYFKIINDVLLLTQETLLLWGDQDKVFPVDLAHELHRYIPNITVLCCYIKVGLNSCISIKYHKNVKHVVYSSKYFISPFKNI